MNLGLTVDMWHVCVFKLSKQAMLLYLLYTLCQNNTSP